MLLASLARISGFQGAEKTVRRTSPMSTKSSTPSLDMTVTHLNVPVGPVLTTTMLASVLCSGTASMLQKKQGPWSLVQTLFVEVEPQTILRSAVEAGASIERVQAFYLETLRNGMHANPAWEKAMEFRL